MTDQTLTGITFTNYAARTAATSIDGDDSTGDLDSTLMTLTSTAHGFSNGEKCLYADGGDAVVITTTSPVLADADIVWLHVIDDDTFSLHESRAEALSDTDRYNLFDTNSSTTNSFTPQSFALEITSAGETTLDGCTFDQSGTNDIDNTSGGLVEVIVLNGGTVPVVTNKTSGSTSSVAAFVTQTVTVSDAAGVTLAGIQVNVFRQDTGLTTVTTGLTDEDGIFTDSTFNYASDTAVWIKVRQSTKPKTFLTSQGFASELLDVVETTHDWETGEAVVYSKDGGSAAVGLTDGTTYYINNSDANSVTMHTTAAAAVAGTGDINLTTNGSETHLLTSTRYFPVTASGTISATGMSVAVTMTEDGNV